MNMMYVCKSCGRQVDPVLSKSGEVIPIHNSTMLSNFNTSIVFIIEPCECMDNVKSSVIKIIKKALNEAEKEG